MVIILYGILVWGEFIMLNPAVYIYMCVCVYVYVCVCV
jgi:hypothetical protein